MSQKKCPKCGESNPVEAVMCWACYTPLSGASVSSASPPGASGGSSEERRKKPIPVWQIGVLGLALLGGVGFAVMTLMGGSSVASDVQIGPTPSTKSPSVSVTVPNFLSSGSGSSSAPAAVSTVAPAAATTATGQMTFVVRVAPKRGISWGTMAIVPTGNVTPQDAAGLAATAAQQMAKTGRWDGLYVYVFQDSQSAALFRKYQRDNNGEPLTDNDFNALQSLWPNTLLRYDYSKGYESLRYPSKNPGGWWGGKGQFARSKT